MAKIRSKSSHISVNMLIINACHLLACHIPGPGGPRGAIPWGHPAPRPPPSRQQLAGPVNETDSHPVCPHSVLPPVYAFRGESEFQPPRLERTDDHRYGTQPVSGIMVNGVRHQAAAPASRCCPLAG